jgi:type IV secretion system protein VirB9
MMMKFYQIIFIVLFFVYQEDIYPVRESRPTAVDSRIRVMVYNPSDVFKFTGYYNYQASIEFASGETIQSISMGDTTGWQIVPSGNRMFIKPIQEDATTNMTIITDKRTYFFELYAEEALDIRDPNMVFSIKFIYPDEEEYENITRYGSKNSNDLMPDLKTPEDLNFNYTISGPENLAPVKIFDDGQFTYLQFRNYKSTTPAIFYIDEKLKENLVNFRISKDKKYTILEGVYRRLSIRIDDKIVCIYNEAY